MGARGWERSAPQRAQAQGTAVARVSLGLRASRAAQLQGACVSSGTGRGVHRGPRWRCTCSSREPAPPGSGSVCPRPLSRVTATRTNLGEPPSPVSRTARSAVRGVGLSVYSFICSFVNLFCIDLCMHGTRPGAEGAVVSKNKACRGASCSKTASQGRLTSLMPFFSFAITLCILHAYFFIYCAPLL